jgi:PKD repeat protein
MVKKVDFERSSNYPCYIAYVSDENGNWDIMLKELPPDIEPPLTYYIDYDDIWHTHDFFINLNATDKYTGIAEIFYRINNGPIRRVKVDGQPYITHESANNTLEFWSVDKAGNEETHKFLLGIKLDKTPPSGWIIINDNKTYANTSDVIIKFDYSDSLSGVSGIRFSNDDLWTNEPEKPPQLKMKNWTLTGGEGERTVHMQIMDKAGNIYTTNDSIIVDSTPPKTTADYDENWHNKDFYINLTSSDYNTTTSPEIYYRINKGPIKNVRADGQPYITNESANNTLEYWSVDEAGNEETHHYLYGIKLDKTSPVADFDLPVKVEAGSQVKFDALKKSYDICSGISRCIWIFGDGTTSEEFNITHVYADTGKYNVTLTIIDMAGNVATCVKTVEVVPRPQLNFWLIIGLSGVITLAVISVVMAKNRSKRKVKKEIRGKPPETYTSPAPLHESVVTKEVKPVKGFRSREEEIDDMVLDYIEAHGGTISLSRAAEDLGITYEELISSIDRLKNAGKLRQE